MQRSPRSIPIAFVVASIGIATYAGMDVSMKALSLSIGAYNAMLWRSAFTIIIAATLYSWRRPKWPENYVIRLHIWRGIVISIMAFLFFWGLKYLPVAEAIGLTFIAPLIALYLAAAILREQINGRSIGASVNGLIGALSLIHI